MFALNFFCVYTNYKYSSKKGAFFLIVVFLIIYFQGIDRYFNTS
jgi:hypothetical protein